MEQLSLIFDKPMLALLTPDEIYANLDQALIELLQKEDRRVEFKSARYDKRALGEYFSMWANTRPSGGVIVLGIEKDGTISGCARLTQGDLNSLEQAGCVYCPESRSESKRIPVVNARGQDDFLLVIRVFYREDKVVRTTANKAFVRIGDEKHELDEAAIRELQIDRRELDLEREPAPEFAWPQSFDSSLVSNFCDSVRQRWALDGEQTNEQILSHRRLGKLNSGVFVPNTACVLVFAKDPLLRYPGCMVRFLRYEGEVERTGAEYNVIKDIPVEGPIPRLIERTAIVIESQLRDFSALGNDGKFYTVPEYPRSAWYEALVNACVHRSYGMKSIPIFVKMFDDRLVIESPGGFPPTVTPENIYDSHHPRNPTTMDALKYLDFVKCHNEGTRRMRTTMSEYKLPTPEFEQKGGDGAAYSVRVTLRNNVNFRKAYVDSRIGQILGESLLRSLDQRERMVLNFVAANGSINVSECQRQLGLSRWHTAKRLLMTMVRKRILQYVKPSTVERTRTYFVLAPRWGGDREKGTH